MAITATKVGKIRQGLNYLEQEYAIVFSGSYPAGGEPLDFAIPGIGLTNKQPWKVDLQGKAGYLYQYDYQNKKVMVRVNTGAGANLGLPEHTAAAYNAGVTGDVIKALVAYPKQAY